nr:bifunctional lysylphosphatidylglycerol flippase/synthetase MprF [Gemmatimonadales bacterium]
GLLALGAGASLLKGFDYEEATLLLVLLGALLPCHRFFYRRTALMAEPFTPGWTLAIMGVVAAALWLTLFAYRHVEYSNELWWRFAFHASAPRSLRAAVGVLASLAIVGTARLLRPAPLDPGPPDDVDLERAAAVIARAGASEANLALLGDKRFLYNEAGTAFIMYGVEGRSWVALHDPVGPDSQLDELAWRFRELVDRHAGWTVFYEVSRRRLPLYLDLGLTLLKLGEEARVPLEEFTLEGAHRKTLRRFHRGVEKTGVSFDVLPAGATDAPFAELRAVSDGWLTLKRTREKSFSLGNFDEHYLGRFPMGIARQGGRIVAFTNIWPSGDREELSADLMRYLPDAPPNVMTWLFVELMLWGRREGYRWFNLGMAPLSGLPNRKLASRWLRLGGFVYRHGEHFYNFKGLRQYKERFDPVWEPRYLASPGGLLVPRVLANVATLVGGGLTGVVGK